MLIRAASVLAAALLAVGVGVFAAVCACAKKVRRAEKADCIIVLGAKVKPDGGMSRSLRYRCEAALKVWQEGAAGRIIACGGQGSDEPAPEGRVMAVYFEKNGVPGDCVTAETCSANTIENIANAKRIMDKNGWRSAVVVTSDYHVERALWIARQAGIEASGAAAKSPDSRWAYWTARVRESCSWMLYGVKRLFRHG